MPRARPRAVRKYSDAFKLTAVRLSQEPGVQVQTVARALEIHPFMLSKWRRGVREGRIVGPVPAAPPPGPAREIAQLQALEKAHARLQEEHARAPRAQGRGLGREPAPRRAPHAGRGAPGQGGPRLSREGPSAAPLCAPPPTGSGPRTSTGPTRSGSATSRISASPSAGATSRSSWTSTRGASSPGRSRGSGRRR